MIQIEIAVSYKFNLYAGTPIIKFNFAIILNTWSILDF